MQTIGDATSRIRGVLKAVKEDPFLTDRFLYSLIQKYGKAVIRRQDNEGKLKSFTSLFETIPCVELIEVDKVEACCIGVRTGCTFRRSKDKLPAIVEGSSGPIIRAVTTLDQSQRLNETYPSTYANMTKSTNFKYNKHKYFWYIDGYLYIPDVEWDAVRLVALFDEDISDLLCANDPEDCIVEQERTLNIPEYLMAEIEAMVKEELVPTMQIPPDGADDAQNVLR